MATAARERAGNGTFLPRADGIGPERWKSPIYQAWAHMKGRCTNPHVERWPQYGGRGITFDPHWEDYAEFHADMAPSWFPGASLGRIDNNGNYGSDNCRWETALQQACNTSRTRLVTYRGESLPLTEWARRYGIKSSTIRQRFYVLGWSIDRCIETPVQSRGGQ